MGRKVPLTFAKYQREALKTDHVQDNIMVAVLGLAGEVGSLAVEHKKKIRDKEKHRFFKERIEEDVGDILWYLSILASRYQLDLETVARNNLLKVARRWPCGGPRQLLLFDEDARAQEQIPRHFAVEFREADGRLRLYVEGEQIGDPLTDNNYGDDGYRFHDVFHLAYAAVLGWSPVTRKFLGRKRKSDPQKDEVEDGGRAAVCEEGVAALVYAYALTRDLLDGATEIDHDILQMIDSITAHLEVHARTPADWERAILSGFRVWHQLRRERGGRVTVDLRKRELFFATLSPARERSARLHPKPIPKREQGASANRGHASLRRRR